MRSRYSNFGRGGAFRCTLCNRMTRETGEQAVGSDLCPQCWTLAGMDNAVNDEGRAPTANEVREREALVRVITARGGDADRVRDFCSYLFR